MMKDFHLHMLTISWWCENKRKQLVHNPLRKLHSIQDAPKSQSNYDYNDIHCTIAHVGRLSPFVILPEISNSKRFIDPILMRVDHQLHKVYQEGESESSFLVPSNESPRKLVAQKHRTHML